ncbi:MAG: hypothetical protein KJP02_04245 [Octadecabacter sp.]|nr:hypothetical protein [Octadecabacter sp.]
MKTFVPFLAFATLVACTDLPMQAALPPVPSPSEDTCNANAYRGLIGQDGTALERVMLLGQVRIIRPGMAVTADYRPERINFDIGEDGRIRSIYCT